MCQSKRHRACLYLEWFIQFILINPTHFIDILPVCAHLMSKIAAQDANVVSNTHCGLPVEFDQVDYIQCELNPYRRTFFCKDSWIRILMSAKLKLAFSLRVLFLV